MALIARNPDGTYASSCALCGAPLTDPIFATPHFLVDPSHDLYRFSDAALHWNCYIHWPDQARFAALYFEAEIHRSKTNSRLRYWTVLLQSAEALVSYGLVVNELCMVLRKSGTEIRIARDRWPHWLSGGWRQECRPGLECEAVAPLLPELARLILPQPVVSASGSPPLGCQ